MTESQKWAEYWRDLAMLRRQHLNELDDANLCEEYARQSETGNLHDLRGFR